MMRGRRHSFNSGCPGTWNVDTAFAEYRKAIPFERRLVGEADYREVVRVAGEVIGDKLVEGYIVKLPSHLGVLAVQAFKARRWRDGRNPNRKKTVDWAYYNKHGVIRPYYNPHTDGVTYRFLWRASPRKLAAAGDYSFKAEPSLRQKLKLAVKRGERYMDTDHEIYQH